MDSQARETDTEAVAEGGEVDRDVLFEMLVEVLRGVNSSRVLSNAGVGLPELVTKWETSARRLDLPALKVDSEELTQMLSAACSWWTTVSSTPLPTLEITVWWDRHKAAEEVRRARAASFTSALVASALAKLTTEERRALGLLEPD